MLGAWREVLSFPPVGGAFLPEAKVGEDCPRIANVGDLGTEESYWPFIPRLVSAWTADSLGWENRIGKKWHVGQSA